MENVKIDKEKLTRKNIWMSKQIASWYEEESTKTGMTQSSIMVMALSSYIDQRKGFEMMEVIKQQALIIDSQNSKE